MPASRSLIALLVGTIAFFALWLIALKPGSNNSTSGGTSKQALGQFQSDINKAHQAVGISNASNAASGNDGTASSAPSAPATAANARATTTRSPATAKPMSPTKPTSPTGQSTHSRAAASRMAAVQHAIAAHKVVAMLFYNPAAADDQAVKKELTSIATHKGKVVKLTIPLSEAGNYTAVTQQVPVNFSPTLVLIAPDGQAGEILGYSDRFEIANRVDGALAAK
jgi:hypothetical protein